MPYHILRYASLSHLATFLTSTIVNLHSAKAICLFRTRLHIITATHHRDIITGLVCAQETTWQHLGRDQHRRLPLAVSHSLHYTVTSSVHYCPSISRTEVNTFFFISYFVCIWHAVIALVHI